MIMRIIENLEYQMQNIRNEYASTYTPKKYISDIRYRRLQLEWQKMQTALAEKDKPKPKSKSNKRENFESLSSQEQQKLIDADYNIELDPDNILSFYATSIDSVLGNEIMNSRIGSVKGKLSY